MEYSKLQTSIKPKTLETCYRIMGNRVYYELSGKFVYYDFENIKELLKMKSERKLSNMRYGVVDDWECCNKDGEWSLESQLNLLKSRMNKSEQDKLKKISRLIRMTEDEISKSEILWIEENRELLKFVHSNEQ